MANPNLNGPTLQVFSYGHSIKMTDTVSKNLLANLASSGKLVLATAYVWNYNGTGPASISAERYNAAGTAMCNNTGITATVYGSTVTAGTGLGGPYAISVPANSGLYLFNNISLNEDTALIFTASAASYLTVWLDWKVLG